MGVNDVGKIMAPLKRAFFEVIKDKEKAEELAFNYAEIFVELPILKDQLHSLMVSGTMSAKDLQNLHTFAVHWLYHLNEINLLLSGMSEDSSLPTAKRKGAGNKSNKS